MRKYNHKISERANESLNERESVVHSQRLVFAAIASIIIFIGILLGTSMKAMASSRGSTASYNKYYKSIRIEAGDTLWTIADEYISGLNVDKQDYIEEICTLNNICEDEIHAGDYIIVVYYSQDIK